MLQNIDPPGGKGGKGAKKGCEGVVSEEEEEEYVLVVAHVTDRGL